MGFFSTDTVDSGDVGVLAMDASRRLLVSIEADNAGIGGGTQYTEDDVVPANPVGTATMVQRDDALGGITPAEGDWTHLFADDEGSLWTRLSQAVAVSGTVTVTDDGNLTLGANDGVDIGDVGVDGVIPGTGATQLGKAEDAAHSTGDTGVMMLGVRKDTGASVAGTDGDYTPVQFDATGNLRVNLAVQEAATLTTTSSAQGTVAHDSADSGNPLKIGAQARTTNPTAVADADRVNLTADDLGRLLTRTAARDLTVHNTITLTNTTETTLIAAAASTFHDLVKVIATNTSSTAVRVDIRDDTGGTVRFSLYLAADGGGAALTFPVPVTASAVNDNWTAQLSASVTDVRIFAQAVKEV